MKRSGHAPKALLRKRRADLAAFALDADTALLVIQMEREFPPIDG